MAAMHIASALEYTGHAGAVGLIMIQMGAVLAGKYRVDRVFGQGGMGVVVQAQAVARLKSEHVARVSDVGSPGSRKELLVA